MDCSGVIIFAPFAGTLFVWCRTDQSAEKCGIKIIA